MKILFTLLALFAFGTCTSIIGGCTDQPQIGETQFVDYVDVQDYCFINQKWVSCPPPDGDQSLHGCPDQEHKQ